MYLYIQTHTMMISPYVYAGLNNTKVHHDSPHILFEKLLSAVTKDFNMPPDVLLSRRRWRDCIYGRQLMAYILRVHYRMTVMKIGRLLKRDHSTILHATKSHYNDYACVPEYREICNRIMIAVGIWPS
jgi:chromosomal replication initiation ATPase DnaA